MSADIVERLRAGVPEWTDHGPGGDLEITRYDTDAAETTMAEAVATIERLTRERDEAREWAGEWHRVCQAIAAVMGLPEPEGSTFAAIVRDKWSGTVPDDWYASSNDARNRAEAALAKAREALRQIAEESMFSSKDRIVEHARAALAPATTEGETVSPMKAIADDMKAGTATFISPPRRP